MLLSRGGDYWIVSYHPDKPWVMEVRRSSRVATPPRPEVPSRRAPSSGRCGAAGRPPQRLVGVGFTAEGFDRSTYHAAAGQL